MSRLAATASDLCCRNSHAVRLSALLAIRIKAALLVLVPEPLRIFRKLITVSYAAMLSASRAGMHRRGQAMLDAGVGAEAVEIVVAGRGPAAKAEQAIGELL
ncbi:MAG: hypothetical protein FJX25_17415, partial [Alphaproteobacteria bacterium]|nr:hypothetical protein [Alphaproteobacteria bacterium]